MVSRKNMLPSTNQEANKWHSSLLVNSFKKNLNILRRRIWENDDIAQGHFSAIEESVSVSIEFAFKSNEHFFSIEVLKNT